MTTFRNIIDRAYISYMKDYRLDAFYKQDKDGFYEYLSTFLLNAIDEFQTDCLVDLSYEEKDKLDEEEMREYKDYVFNKELSSDEIRILCLLIAINWYQKEIDDVIVFKPHLQTKEFKGLANDQNITRRMDRLCELKENLSNNITSYQLGKITKNGMNFFSGGE